MIQPKYINWVVEESTVVLEDGSLRLSIKEERTNCWWHVNLESNQQM